MALSKEWTAKKIMDTLRILTREIGVDKMQRGELIKYINLALIEVADMLNAAQIPDYGTIVNVNDAGSAVGTLHTVSGYVNSTKTLEQAVASLSSADIGKRCVVFQTVDATGVPSYVTISTITNVVDTFITIAHAAGSDLPSAAGRTARFAVFPAQSSLEIDVSSLKIDKIIKLEDATNGLVGERKDLEFSNLANFSEYDSSVFYFHFGEKLYLFKGSSVASFGTLTLYYYRQPTLLSADGDYIDIKDAYVPLVMAKAKTYIYEHVSKIPPESVTGLIDQKTREIRAGIMEEQSAIAQRGKKL